ncbi:MAG: tRNA epoxyqueuosine(34) reductase QueG [Prevotellaceae bacterium]|nr:tRNA epoxyqueuosine(34) reductase QueG [Prevotellaceae bacterium]
MTVDTIKKAAQGMNFDACEVIALNGLPSEQQQRFSDWLQKGYSAQMSYLRRFADKRADPRLMLRDGAKTAVIVLFSYNTKWQQPQRLPQVSRYAYGMDYHELLKKKLWALLKILQQENPKLRGRTFTDSAPLQERYWAATAGLGWIGKNGMLINKQLGSYVYIGTLLLNAEVEVAPPVQVKNCCGTCTRCIEACPTQAIVDNALVDARKCWSYKTIEAHTCEKNAASDENFGQPKYIFGCDICQNACPWNKKAAVVQHDEMQILPLLQTLTHEDWLAMSAEDFEKNFEHSAIKRATLEGIKRNVSKQ